MPDRQQRRVPEPPAVDDPTVARWMRDVTDYLNTLPPFSAFSYSTPEGNVSAVPGTLGHNLQDGTLWRKGSGDTSSGWVEL